MTVGLHQLQVKSIHNDFCLFGKFCKFFSANSWYNFFFLLFYKSVWGAGAGGQRTTQIQTGGDLVGLGGGRRVGLEGGDHIRFGGPPRMYKRSGEQMRNVFIL